MSWKAKFDLDGIGNVRILDLQQYSIVKAYAEQWVRDVIRSRGVSFSASKSLTRYADWQISNDFPHSSAFAAASRFSNPPEQISKLLLGVRTQKVLRDIGISEWEVMDEGLGWLGFRIIRPGAGDGYPLSRKNWGASKEVISFWVPICGYGAQYSLKYVLGSHLRDYESYLPVDTKFTKGELRLAPSEKVTLASQGVSPGKALIYGPNLLHTEDVPTGSKTRINLEFRINPL